MKGEVRQSAIPDDDDELDGAEEKRSNGGSHAPAPQGPAAAAVAGSSSSSKKSAGAVASGGVGDAASSVGKLDIRVGRITHVAAVENSSKLYVRRRHTLVQQHVHAI